METSAPAELAGNPQPNGGMPLSPDEAKKRAMAAKLVAASFGEIVTLMMRAPAYKHMALQDLEWLVAPGVIFGQFVVAEAQSKQNGAVMPVGAVLWAMVSDDVDKRLSTEPGKPIRLHTREWRSGDIPWIIATAGEGKVVSSLLQRLAEHKFRDKSARMHARGSDGKPTVAILELHARPDEASRAQ